MSFHSAICGKTSHEKIKAMGCLCAEATIVVMQFAEQSEFSLPCTSVEDGVFLANRLEPARAWSTQRDVGDVILICSF
jgi:hypothetical protein